VVNLSRCQLMFEQTSPSVENKLDSILERLDTLCFGEDGGGALRDNSEHERWAKLFE
jgi:hypothetical protein